MFIPGCGCCQQQQPPCQPCPYCSPTCLTVTLSGFDHGADNCNECKFLDDTTFVLKRPPDPTLSATASVASATGSGATFSVTTNRNATDGSYAVTGISLTGGGSNYSLGDGVVFSSNGCITEQPEATITIATTKPQSRMNIPGVGNTDFLRLAAGGAVVPVSYQQQTAADGNPYWSVGSIGQPFAGAGYSAMQVVQLTPETGVVVEEPATARITEVNRTAPTLGVRIHRAGGGTFDGGLVVGRTQGLDANGRAVWSVSSVGIGWWFPSDFTAADTVSFYTSGPTATTARAATATISVSQSGAITSFTITDGGEYYDTSGIPLAAELLTSGRLYKPGVITSATLVSGGKIFGPNSCNYRSDAVCAVCPDNAGDELYASLSLGSASHSFSVTRRDWYDYGGGPRYTDTTLISATRPAVDDDGNPIPCDSLTFEPEHFSPQYSCLTNGTMTVQGGACDSASSNYCESRMPDQITLNLSGMARLFVWSSRNGGLPGAISCPGQNGEPFVNYTPFCGECAAYDATLRGVGVSAGLFGYTGGLIQQDCSVVLDLVDDGCNGWRYEGFAPTQPTEFGFAGSALNVDCGGELGSPCAVDIRPAGGETTVSISGPTWGNASASAEAAVGQGGAITSIAVTAPGDGYAREIFTRLQPQMTVTLSGNTGSGAVLSATLTQSGAGEEAYWYVSAVTVTNGGTGYTGAEGVIFTPETGTTTQSPAYAYIVTGRIEPTVIAAAQGGTGASLSVTLSQGTDYNGLTVWSVSSVAVASGGSGYTDGDSVTFTVTDGTEIYGASATVAVGREEPTVTATVQGSGTGAALAPTLTQSGNSWSVSGVTITNGGTGYSQWDYVVFSTTDTTESGAYALVSSVDENGAITGVAIYGGGSYYRSTGVIESVSVSPYWGGEYFKSTGVIESVVVGYGQYGGGGGAYYKSVSTGTAEVDTPTVTIGSIIGQGATATATVDGTVGSATFGQITGVTVTAGGQNYRASGGVWLLSIYFGLHHCDIHLTDPPSPPADQANPFSCDNYASRFTRINKRVSSQPCPSDLLSKSYAMFAQFYDPFYNRFPEGYATYCILPGNGYNTSDVLRVFAFAGDITCQISAG